MKKLILFGSALMLSLGVASAQGRTATSAFDDFADADGSAAGVQEYTTGVNGQGIYWWGGPAATSSSRTVGKYTMSYSNMNSTTGTNFLVNFGTDESVTPNVKQTLNLSTNSMADIEIVIENVSSNKLFFNVELEDIAGKISNYEPNTSDVDTVNLYSTAIPLNGGGDFYPRKARNGFILNANQRDTIRIDLSSVAGKIGGVTRVETGSFDGKPKNSPITSYQIDPTQIHAVLFYFNRKDNHTLTVDAVNKGSYKYQTENLTADVPASYTGDIVIHRFKMGNVLSALPADPNPPITGVNEALVKNSLKVYPNPVKDALSVDFETNESTVVSLSDINGRTVYTTSANAGANKIMINTTGLNGMYILNIATENGKVARKVSINN